MLNRWLGKTTRFSIWLMVAAVLTACGGGGAGSGGFLGTSDEPPYRISITTSNPEGASSNSLQAGIPLIVKVTLTDPNQRAITGVSVTLSSAVGTISPANGASLTNDEGVATFEVTFNGTVGAGDVTASYSGADGEVSASVDVQALETPEYLLELATFDSAGEPSKRFLSDSTLSIVATLYNTVTGDYLPVQDESIAATTTLGELTPNSGATLTSADGEAVFSLSAPAEDGAGVISVIYESQTGEVIERTQNFEVIQVTTGAAYNIEMQLLNPGGNDSRFIEPDAPLTLIVTISSISGTAPIENQIISVTSDLAAVAPASGTQLTDASGRAELSLVYNDVVGAGTVTATVGTDDAQATITLNIATVSDALNRLLKITTRNPSGVIANTISDGQPLSVDVAITDRNGVIVDLDNEIIALNSDIADVQPSLGTSLTSNGVASFDLVYNGTVGAGTINATYTSGGEQIAATQAVEAVANEMYAITLFKSSAFPVTPSRPMTIRVTVREGATASGARVVGDLVTLSSDVTDIEPANGSAILDAQGNAYFTLTFSGIEGAGAVTATYESPNGDTFTNSIAVAAQDEPALYAVDILQPSGSSFSNVDPLSIAVALTSNGVAVANAPIQLSAEVGVISPSNSISLTNAAGIASFSLIGDGATGGGTVTATYIDEKDTEFTDSITVQMLNADQVVDFDRVSMTFAQASPLSIALRGTGGGTGLEERSEVTFRLTDPSGNPVTEQLVFFELSTTLGGMSLLRNQVETNANGEAVATVWAGTIPTPVRVIATTESTPLDDTEDPIRVLSDVLTVSSGVATQQRFTVVADVLNPPDAAAVDGIEVKVTAFLFDRFGNPVPDGTSVSFVSECGGIGASEGGPTGACRTATGSCSVTWFSQNVSDPDPDPSTQVPGFCSDGRATIMGYALGEEDFFDNDADGYFTVGQATSADSWDIASQDVPEAFLNSDDFDNTRVAPEFFVDWNNNGVWDNQTPDITNTESPGTGPRFNGAACAKDESNLDTDYNAQDDCFNNLIYVFDDIVLVPGPSVSNALELSPSTAPVAPGVYDYTLGYRADGWVNTPPLGTTIDVTAEGRCKILGTDSWEVPNNNSSEPYRFRFEVAEDAEGTDPSGVTITYQTPGGTPIEVNSNACTPPTP